MKLNNFITCFILIITFLLTTSCKNPFRWTDAREIPVNAQDRVQKNLEEADGSTDNLPPPADAPENFGLGIKREAPKHY